MLEDQQTHSLQPDRRSDGGQPETLITRDLVAEKLKGLETVFRHLRGELQRGGHLNTYKDDLKTRLVLDDYCDHISDEQAAMQVGIYTPEEREHAVASLRAGSVSRTILLVYFLTTEETNWKETRGQFNSIHSYKRTDNFPQDWVTDQVFERLQSPSED